jgi:hypothetical protein
MHIHRFNLLLSKTVNFNKKHIQVTLKLANVVQNSQCTYYNTKKQGENCCFIPNIGLFGEKGEIHVEILHFLQREEEKKRGSSLCVSYRHLKQWFSTGGSQPTFGSRVLTFEPTKPLIQ